MNQKTLRSALWGATILSAGCLSSFAAHASLVEVIPQSYSFDRATDTGTYQYHDWTGRQLIDGAYGSNDWRQNLGNGNAYEWVGWANDPVVNIDFTFAQKTKINQISVGTTQDHIHDVVIPDAYFYGYSNGNWLALGSIISPESSANDWTHKTLTLGGLNAEFQKFRVSLRHNINGPWTFTDEIDFYQMSAVPLPASIWMMGAGLMGLVAYRRKRRL